jgi:hypothetical protein
MPESEWEYNLAILKGLVTKHNKEFGTNYRVRLKVNFANVDGVSYVENVCEYRYIFYSESVLNKFESDPLTYEDALKFLHALKFLRAIRTSRKNTKAPRATVAKSAPPSSSGASPETPSLRTGDMAKPETGAMVETSGGKDPNTWNHDKRYATLKGLVTKYNKEFGTSITVLQKKEKIGRSDYVVYCFFGRTVMGSPVDESIRYFYPEAVSYLKHLRQRARAWSCGETILPIFEDPEKIPCLGLVESPELEKKGLTMPQDSINTIKDFVAAARDLAFEIKITVPVTAIIAEDNHDLAEYIAARVEDELDGCIQDSMKPEKEARFDVTVEVNTRLIKT